MRLPGGRGTASPGRGTGNILNLYPGYLDGVEEVGEVKSSGIAAVLSLVIPGAGQIYNGEIGKGILFIILAFIAGILFLFLIGIPIYLILVIVAVLDAYKGAERWNQAHKTRQCMRCGAEIPMNLNACPHCGNPIPWPSTQPPAVPGNPPPPATPAAPVAQSFCSNCGAPLASGAVFCTSCGAQVGQTI